MNKRIILLCLSSLSLSAASQQLVSDVLTHISLDDVKRARKRFYDDREANIEIHSYLHKWKVRDWYFTRDQVKEGLEKVDRVAFQELQRYDREVQDFVRGHSVDYQNYDRFVFGQHSQFSSKVDFYNNLVKARDYDIKAVNNIIRSKVKLPDALDLEKAKNHSVTFFIGKDMNGVDITATMSEKACGVEFKTDWATKCFKHFNYNESDKFAADIIKQLKKDQVNGRQQVIDYQKRLDTVNRILEKIKVETEKQRKIISAAMKKIDDDIAANDAQFAKTKKAMEDLERDYEDQERKAEEAKRRHDEEERKRIEDEKKRIEDEKKRIEDEKRRIDDERKRIEKEKQDAEKKRKKIEEERKRKEETAAISHNTQLIKQVDAYTKVNRKLINLNKLAITQNKIDIADLRRDFTMTKQDINAYRRKSSAAIAGMAAMNNIPVSSGNGSVSLGIGFGTYDGENAISLGLGYHITESLSLKTSMATSTNDVTPIVGASVDYQFK